MCNTTRQTQHHTASHHLATPLLETIDPPLACDSLSPCRTIHQMIRPQRTTTPARIACLLLVVFSCASCELKPPDPRFHGPTKPKHGPKEFWLNNGSEPEYIDPGLCSDSAGGDVIFNTFAALTESHPQTLEPIPDIARRWDISDDGRVYTFHLRPSKWSDGRTLTAKDFEWSWKLSLIHI